MEENDSNLCLTIALSFTIALAFSALCKWRRRHSQNPNYRLPPGPAGYPIIGCIPQTLTNKPTFRWAHEVMRELDTEIACIPLGRVPVIFVASPELAREFVRYQDAAFASRPEVMSNKQIGGGRLLSIGLLPFGERWKVMRGIIFSRVILREKSQSSYQKRREEADHLVRYIYNQCRSDPSRNGVVNVRHVAQHYCTNFIRRLVFNKRFFGLGREDGGPGVEEEEHVEGIFAILSHLSSFSIADYVPFLEFLDLDGEKRKMNNAVRLVKKYHDPEIEGRVEMWEQGARKVEEDMLDVLINLKDGEGKPLMTIQEIKTQLIEFMIATVDNPSNAFEWALAEMINQPDILERAVAELDEVVGKDRLVQESDIPQLNFIKACAIEAFRLHPMSPQNVAHESIQDAVVGGYFIPKGSHILISRLGLGRNPKTWQDPLRYDPERHLQDNNKTIVLDQDPELRMVTFGTGRRGCTGVWLGSRLTTMLFARLIQGFSWSKPPDVSKIELIESKTDMFMAKPLVLRAEPRLEIDVYEDLLK